LRELPLASADVLEWSDGPVTAIARCRRCDGLGLVELLDWDGDHRVRIFGLAAFAPGPLAVYERNVQRGSCDPGRAAREAEALLASAGPVERLVALDVATGLVLATAERSRDVVLPRGAWQERLPASGDASWFSRLGLGKATAGPGDTEVRR
jgi:hypothetical protein